MRVNGCWVEGGLPDSASKMKSFAVTTLGCKVNRYESEAISEELEDLGWQLTDEAGTAELCIVNTCTVTQKAAMQARQAVRKAIRSHPKALIVVTGCYAQTAPHVLEKIPGIHAVVGNTLKGAIGRLAERLSKNSSVLTLVEDISRLHAFQDLAITRFGNRTRPFLKIQDGCDAFCTYCIIPHGRGRSRSLAPETVLTRVQGLKEQGFAEVVLCGINLGRYGLDLDPPTSLLDLIRSLEGPSATRRLRLSSIEPTEISETLVAHLQASERVCRHLHIPLQSGDDDVLRRMNRHYGSEFYRALIHHIVEAMPNVAVGVDVLIGFPGETEGAFARTCRLINELPIAYLHVFPFSVQKGTVAESLLDQRSPETIKKRAQVVRQIGQAKRSAFYEKALGSTLEVLIEGTRDRTTGHLRGLSQNYIPVHIEGPDRLFHQLVIVRPTKVECGRVFGECLSRP